MNKIALPSPIRIPLLVLGGLSSLPVLFVDAVWATVKKVISFTLSWVYSPWNHPETPEPGRSLFSAVPLPPLPVRAFFTIGERRQKAIISNIPLPPECLNLQVLIKQVAEVFLEEFMKQNSVKSNFSDPILALGKLSDTLTDGILNRLRHFSLETFVHQFLKLVLNELAKKREISPKANEVLKFEEANRNLEIQRQVENISKEMIEALFPDETSSLSLAIRCVVPIKLGSFLKNVIEPSYLKEIIHKALPSILDCFLTELFKKSLEKNDGMVSSWLHSYYVAEKKEEAFKKIRDILLSQFNQKSPHAEFSMRQEDPDISLERFDKILQNLLNDWQKGDYLLKKGLFQNIKTPQFAEFVTLFESLLQSTTSDLAKADLRKRLQVKLFEMAPGFKFLQESAFAKVKTAAERKLFQNQTLNFIQKLEDRLKGCSDVYGALLADLSGKKLQNNAPSSKPLTVPIGETLMAIIQELMPNVYRVPLIGFKSLLVPYVEEKIAPIINSPNQLVKVLSDILKMRFFTENQTIDQEKVQDFLKPNNQAKTGAEFRSQLELIARVGYILIMQKIGGGMTGSIGQEQFKDLILEGPKPLMDLLNKTFELFFENKFNNFIHLEYFSEVLISEANRINSLSQSS